MAEGTLNLGIHTLNFGSYQGTTEEFIKYVLDKFENLPNYEFHVGFATKQGTSTYFVMGFNYWRGRTWIILVPQIANVWEIYFADREGTTDTIRQLTTQSYTPPA